MSEELYRKYRPTKFSEVVGQEGVVRTLNDFGKRKKMPHFILLVGESGCGKTTIARILRKKLGCSDSDFHEKDCGQFRGIDMVREISSRIGLSPIGGGKCRVWLIDECHKLTGDAQSAFLKMLEDTPDHVYFILATTDPRKLLPTIRTRATEIQVKPLKNPDMIKLLTSIAEKEEFKLTEDVRDKIIDHAEGSPRKALVLMNQVIGAGTEEEQIEAVESGDSSAKAIEIFRALINDGTTWMQMAKILKSIDKAEDDEGIRYLVLACCTTVLLGGGKLSSRAFRIIDTFREPFFYTKRAGLVAACYEVVSGEV